MDPVAPSVLQLTAYADADAAWTDAAGQLPREVGLGEEDVDEAFEKEMEWYKAAQLHHTKAKEEYLAFLEETMGNRPPYKWSEHHVWLPREKNGDEKAAAAAIAAAADATSATTITPTVIPAAPGSADSEPPLYGAEKAADAAIAAADAAATAAAVATVLAIPAAEHAHLAAMGFPIPDQLLAPPPAPAVDPMVKQARALIVPEMEELSKEECRAQRKAEGFDDTLVQTLFQERMSADDDRVS